MLKRRKQSRQAVEAQQSWNIPRQRAFKTAWFVKTARKHGISDEELALAVQEILLGQAQNLGGGVWKKRLSSNRERAIVLAKGEQNWFFVFLYAKSDRQGITPVELAGFRHTATRFGAYTPLRLDESVRLGELVEILYGRESKENAN